MTRLLFLFIPSGSRSRQALWRYRAILGIREEGTEHGGLERIIIALSIVESGKGCIVLDGVVAAEVYERESTVIADDGLHDAGEDFREQRGAIAGDHEGGFEMRASDVLAISRSGIFGLDQFRVRELRSASSNIQVIVVG